MARHDDGDLNQVGLSRDRPLVGEAQGRSTAATADARMTCSSLNFEQCPVKC